MAENKTWRSFSGRRLTRDEMKNMPEKYRWYLFACYSKPPMAEKKVDTNPPMAKKKVTTVDVDRPNSHYHSDMNLFGSDSDSDYNSDSEKSMPQKRQKIITDNLPN
ncbi:hypothetical protein RDI58_013508 [Solanum bulbocastanum]|uniref:Uncharacterized protein n=1 Tax=Solanum bulbocastanum TaxID=147425 RepID=A0AAN8TJP5_SOLBU